VHVDVDKTLFKHAINPSSFADFQEGRDDKIFTIVTLTYQILQLVK
jgi:hypothetical protein